MLIMFILFFFLYVCLIVFVIVLLIVILVFLILLYVVLVFEKMLESVKWIKFIYFVDVGMCILIKFFLDCMLFDFCFFINMY